MSAEELPPDSIPEATDDDDPGMTTTRVSLTMKPPPVGVVMDTDSCSSASSMQDDDNDEDDDEYDARMPLLHYVRIATTATRDVESETPLQDPAAAAVAIPADLVSASCLGKVVLNSESTPPEQDHAAAALSTTTHPESAAAFTGTSSHYSVTPPPMNLWQRDFIPLLWMGHESGKLSLHMLTATSAVPVLLLSASHCLDSHNVATANAVTRQRLCLNDANTNTDADATHSLDRTTTDMLSPAKQAIIDVSMDASGTLLAAINHGGMLGVFSTKYKLVWNNTTTASTTTAPERPTADTPATSSATNTPASATISSASAKPKSSNPFSGIFSAFTGQKQTQQQAPPALESVSQSPSEPVLAASPVDESSSQLPSTTQAPVPTLAFASIALAHRIRYPQSFGPPSCMVVDPASTQRRELSVVVGFQSGRLMLTRKRGMFVQRRVDSVLYQGVPEASNDNDKELTATTVSNNVYGGIEALTWRGSLLAWADASGIRIMDMDTLTRLAHVDRPTGAKPSLYPTLRDLKPHLVFETAETLLCGWGDCLLSLQVREMSRGGTPARRQVTRTASTDNSISSEGDLAEAAISIADEDLAVVSETPMETSRSSSPPAPPLSPTLPQYSPASRHRRIVECTMAWQLDCVAVGVVPMDEDHVAVLGVVPPFESNEDERASTSDEQQGNETEIQIISRSSGAVIYADLLPLLKVTQPSRNDQFVESVRGHNLLSTFCFPKVDNGKELKDEQQRLQQVDESDLGIFAMGPRAVYIDPHLRWKLEMSLFDEEDEVARQSGTEHPAGDTDSVDSDDYGIIFRPYPTHDAAPSVPKELLPPSLVVASGTDVVLARLSDIDDAVSHALAERKAGLALRRALMHVTQLRRHEFMQLVDEYFLALLRLPRPRSNDLTGAETLHEDEAARFLSLRRMKLAAEAMPVLLGGEISMWAKWIGAIEDVPGALFLARKFVPVRDPILPDECYSSVLQKMLHQVEQMVPGRLAEEAAGHFLDTLVAWGSTAVLKRFIKLFQYESLTDRRILAPLRAMEESLRRRETQSASCFLHLHDDPLSEAQQSTHDGAPGEVLYDTADALYDVDDMTTFLLDRVGGGKDSLFGSQFLVSLRDESTGSLVMWTDSRVSLEALVRLKMMKGSFDDALRYYLLIGSHYSTVSLDEMEEKAIASVNLASNANVGKRSTHASYTHVLSIIESLHLHQCLLDTHFLAADGMPPLFALLLLVGLDTLGEFLIENCVLPQNSVSVEGSTSSQSNMISLAEASGAGERRGTLPLDLVSRQLERRPKLLHWYLHLVSLRKPEVYVKFPTTATPPEDIIRLHRKHMDLYIRFAGANRDSASVFRAVEAYRVPETNTPLLSFIKVTLQLGALSPAEIAKKIEVERKGSDGNSHTFALELAFIMEQFGGDKEEEARLILDLYLKGVESLMLAVSFAQRSRLYSSVLWGVLIDYCLESVIGERQKKVNEPGDGSLFGSLLEAAALSGADLAKLVSQIPPEMAIEGLRPRLVAAVTDYRLKVQIGEKAATIARNERRALLQEVEYRSRRGQRVHASSFMTRTLTIPTRFSQIETASDIRVGTTKFQRKPLLSPNDNRRFYLSQATK